MNESEFHDEVLKLTPPVGVSTLTVLGVPLHDMVYVMTILYILIQIVCTLYRTYLIVKKGG